MLYTASSKPIEERINFKNLDQYLKSGLVDNGIDLGYHLNFKVEPLKTLIPIDEPENGRLDFHYPADYVREKYNQPFNNQ